jgi:hypothetical protein
MHHEGAGMKSKTLLTFDSAEKVRPFACSRRRAIISAGAHRPFIRFSRRRVETNQVQLVPGQQLP